MGAKIKLADDIVNGRVPEDRRKRTRAENPVTVVRRLLVQDALEAKDNEGEYVHNNANSVRRALLPELDEVDVRTIQRDMVFPAGYVETLEHFMLPDSDLRYD